MGSGNSKGAAGSSSSAGGRVIATRSKGVRVFRSSCFGDVTGSSDADDQIEDSSYLKNESCTDKTETESNQIKHENCGKARGGRSNQVPSISNLEFDGWDQESVADTNSVAGSSSTQTVVTQSSNPSSSFRSRFNFLPDNFSFRLNRAASLGSSEAYSLFSTSLTISNTENHNGSRQDEAVASSHMSQYPDPASGTGPPRSFGSNRTETESFETRRPYRRIRAQEPVEGSIQFSRTLSVGRLRDRVLRRTTSSEGSFGHLQEDNVPGDIRQGHGRQLWGTVAGASSDGSSALLQASNSDRLSGASSRSLNRRQENDVDSPGESNSHDLLEHRTSFLERRRRARSQVRALQRLGSRFENLAGHDRSCILSGQHRTGRCLCQTNTSANGLDDDRSTRASISRIVMLAEALFEVLDEIHQQSVVLSSRPSVSSLGSVPAPKEVVECMPLSIYARSQKHQNEDTAQCYICLVEYEEGDCMRVLPCHHEFHQACVDKWLKEIHRVCPLCRGDVCRSDAPSVEKVD